MQNRLSDRIWLAWRVLRGSVVSWRADGRSFTLDFDYTSAEAKRFMKGGTS